MRNPASNAILKTSLAGLVAGISLMSGAATAGNVEDGKALAFDRKKGNCLACHYIEGGESPGNIGPPLVEMKARFPDRAKLRAQVWDATVANPESIMLPFGKNKILSESELDKVVDFILTL